MKNQPLLTTGHAPMLCEKMADTLKLEKSTLKSFYHGPQCILYIFLLTRWAFNTWDSPAWSI